MKNGRGARLAPLLIFRMRHREQEVEDRRDEYERESAFKMVVINGGKPAGHCLAWYGSGIGSREGGNRQAAANSYCPFCNQVKIGDVFEVAVWLQGFNGSYGGVQGYEVHMKYDSEANSACS